MEVVREGTDVLVATERRVRQADADRGVPGPGSRRQGRADAKIMATRGGLVGALVVRPEDELFAITSNGGVIRTSAERGPTRERKTMGVQLMDLPDGVTLVAIARNADEPDEQG